MVLWNTGISLGVVALACMFVLVFVCTLAALRHGEMFSKSSNWVVALCTAVLSVMGLKGFGPQGISLKSGASRDAEGWLNFITLPYATLGLAMLAVLVMLLILRIWNWLPRQRGADHDAVDEIRSEAERRPDSMSMFDRMPGSTGGRDRLEQDELAGANGGGSDDRQDDDGAAEEARRISR